MNLTDEQIIKALECCEITRLNQDCIDLKCPFATEYGCNIDQEDLRNKALDIINRKQAVNELQAKEIVDLKIKVEQQNAEIKELMTFANEFKDKAELLEIEKSAMQHRITEQKAEIERLRHILVNFMGEIFEWGNKNDVDTRIFAQIAILDKEKDEAVKQIKAEAIKEFAERLKRHCYFNPKDQRNAVAEVVIDYYVKEMVGDTE